MSEPDGNEAGEARGRRISRLMSNNLVVKFFAGSKSIERIERMTFKILRAVPIPRPHSKHQGSAHTGQQVTGIHATK